MFMHRILPETFDFVCLFISKIVVFLTFHLHVIWTLSPFLPHFLVAFELCPLSSLISLYLLNSVPYISHFFLFSELCPLSSLISSYLLNSAPFPSSFLCFFWTPSPFLHHCYVSSDPFPSSFLCIFWTLTLRLPHYFVSSELCLLSIPFHPHFIVSPELCPLSSLISSYLSNSVPHFQLAS